MRSTAPVHRHMVRRYARLKAQQIFLAVHRVEFTVFYRRLEPGEFGLLQAIGRGRESEKPWKRQRIWSRNRSKRGLQIGRDWAGSAAEMCDAENTEAI